MTSLDVEVGDVYGCGNLLRSRAYWRRHFGSSYVRVGEWLWDSVAVVGGHRSDSEDYST